MTFTYNDSQDDFDKRSDISDEEREQLKSLVKKDKSEMPAPDLTNHVKLALRRKFTHPEWALFFEFHAKDRRVDAVAFNLFPSRNFKTIGFEIKASRSDWKKELQDVSKADYFVRQCDQFYVVAGHTDIVKKRELPDGWGLYEMKAGGKLYETVEADPTDHQQRRTDRELFARAVKQSMSDRQEMYASLGRAERKGYREGKEEAKEKLLEEAKSDKIEDEVQKELRQLRRKAEKYEQLEEAGLSVYGERSIKRLNRAKRLLMDTTSEEFGSIDDAVDTIRDNADKIEELNNLIKDGLEEKAAEEDDDK